MSEATSKTVLVGFFQRFCSIWPIRHSSLFNFSRVFFSCFQVFKISRWRVCVLSVLKVVYLLWVDLLASSTVLQLPLPTASFIICSANSAPSFSFARYISRLIRFWCPRIRLCETLFSPFRHRSMSKRLKWKRVVVIRIMEDKCCGERCVRNLFMSCLSFWLLL